MASNTALENFFRTTATRMNQLQVDATDNRSVIIQLDDAGVQRAANQPENENQTAPPNAPVNATVGGAPPVQSALNAVLLSNIPCLLIVLTKVLYVHKLGILVFVAMNGMFMHANSSLCRCIAQSKKEIPLSSVWLIGCLTASIFSVYYIFDEQKLYRSLYLVFPEINEISLGVLLWVTITTDFIIKFATIILKAVVTLVPQVVLPVKKKGKWYMLVELLSQSYRSIVPITPWFYYLYYDEQIGTWIATILLAIYFVFKSCYLIIISANLWHAVVRFRLEISFGSVPNRSQIESCNGLCSICQDDLKNPVVLSCAHVFCEDCIIVWVSRVRTCPLCRANIVERPQWRDGTTCPELLIL